MFWFKKKLICDHDWHELETGREYSISGYIDGLWEDTTHIYCPRCDTRKRVTKLEGKLIIKANQIKKSYKTLHWKSEGRKL